MTEPVGPAFLQDLASARKGLRSCLACRMAFPNRLGLVKHQVQGCWKAERARKR